MNLPHGGWMPYEAVGVYNLDGEFLGYSVKNQAVDKLHNNNLWTESPEDVADLKAQLARLNDQTAVLAYWPDVRDPEVQALLDDANFEPLTLSPVEVVDEENSIHVWLEEPSDENPYGRIDQDASTIVYKDVMAPAPTDVARRWKKAQEIVARRRADAG
jgi:hypothetical protein